MISVFPFFKNLEIDDKQEVKYFTQSYPPYSDFNFASLWTWNAHNETELSLLNNNLTIKFRDYITDEYFYSFIGANRVKESIQTLLEFSQKKGLKKQLKLIPEHNFSKCDINDIKNLFSIDEDLDNYDYILSVEKLSSMEGKKLHQKRKLLNRFLKKYDHEVIIQKIEENGVESKVLDFFHQWKQIRKKDDTDNSYDLRAIKRLFIHPAPLNLNIISIYNNHSLIGFTIFEVLENGYAVSEFQKANIKYDGISEFMNYSLVNYLKKQGCIYVNFEQDMGIPGLRRAKLDYDPTYLKKYIIEPNSV
jgi:hypothetical protein